MRVGAADGREDGGIRSDPGDCIEESVMSRMTAVSVLASGCWVALISSAIAQGPSPGVMADRYAKAAQQNAAKLQHYNWTMRVALTVNGDAKPPQLFLMSH